jgi:hypothetical protein
VAGVVPFGTNAPAPRARVGLLGNTVGMPPVVMV